MVDQSGFKVLDVKEIERIALEEAEQALQHPFQFKGPIKKVAVIGAGPSGLPSARHLKEAGIDVKVFERGSSVGGVWCYSELAPLKPKMPTSRISRDIEKQALEVKEEKQKHLFEMTPETMKLLLAKSPPSACYRDLYNNIATSMFAYPDFPFPKGIPEWCSHEVTQQYFEAYADHYHLTELIEFNTSVDLVTKDQANDCWELTLSKYDVYSSGIVRETRWKETFDGVVVASGRHQDPYVPDFKDFIEWNKTFPDKTMHSVQYRRPEDYVDKHVLVIGGGVSAVDIVRGLEGFSAMTTMAIQGPFESPYTVYNIVRSTIPKSVSIKPNVSSFSDKHGNINGCITFEDGTMIDDIDQVIFCTGFSTRLTFLDGLVIDKPDKEAKLPPPRPLYDDIPPSHIALGPKHPLNVYREVFLMSDPTMAFVGLPPIVSTPNHFDVQAMSVARVWTGKALLPDTPYMQKFASEFNPGIDMKQIFINDRKRKTPFITWLNHHAKHIKTDDALPVVEDYPEDYEKLNDEAINFWIAFSTENFKRIREQVRARLL
ncbi:Thiol-specific monooxygenase [Choanephora cucurbitarum]|uniref:Thiol-specific monooxygenase n=1 Tax=Choanephora cucurbitarum TaxID=101091 RepID=A0A1C7NHC9_9FUNG|nr:Thiol-specific monooxygenase [Choanephora cucurbitarum]